MTRDLPGVPPPGIVDSVHRGCRPETRRPRAHPGRGVPRRPPTRETVPGVTPPGDRPDLAARDARAH